MVEHSFLLASLWGGGLCGCAGDPRVAKPLGVLLVCWCNPDILNRECLRMRQDDHDLSSKTYPIQRPFKLFTSQESFGSPKSAGKTDGLVIEPRRPVTNSAPSRDKRAMCDSQGADFSHWCVVLFTCWVHIVCLNSSHRFVMTSHITLYYYVVLRVCVVRWCLSLLLRCWSSFVLVDYWSTANHV